jgi:hypothetical protein
MRNLMIYQLTIDKGYISGASKLNISGASEFGGPCIRFVNIGTKVGFSVT